ncbi:MAG TPA: hypothetical protein VJP77_09890 [Planctomycetota bacterium]|nr:hypothetical protein [Planctomycetota bacterium]
MSATQRFQAALAAAGSVTNLVAGTIYEFTGPRPRRVTIFAVQDGAVLATPLVFSVTSGTNIQVEPNTPVPNFTAGLGPNEDQHRIVTFISAPGDRLVIALRNTDPANASNYRFLLKFEE